MVTLFVLERTDDCANGSEIERCTGAEALSALLAHAQRFDPLHVTSRKRHLQNFLDISAVVPVFSVRFANAFERFDDLLDQLITAAGVACPARGEAR